LAFPQNSTRRLTEILISGALASKVLGMAMGLWADAGLDPDPDSERRRPQCRGSGDHRHRLYG